MKHGREGVTRALKKLGLAMLLVMLASMLIITVAYADDCETDPTNLQDCMRTGTYRELITIIAVIFGVSPVVIANQLLNLSPRDIAELIKRDGWDPEAEAQKAVDWLKKRVDKRPEFEDLRGPPPRPVHDRIYDGTKAKQILKDINMFDKLKNLDPSSPDYHDRLHQVQDEILSKVKDHKRVKAVAIDWKKGPDGQDIIDEDRVVLVVEEPEYGPPVKSPVDSVTKAPPDSQPSQPEVKKTPPPESAPPPVIQPPPEKPPPEVKPPPEKHRPPSQPPPDPDKLKKKWQKKLDETMRRIRMLEKKKQQLLREYVRKVAEWEWCRRSGYWLGLIDVLDIGFTVAGPLSTKSVPGAYGKDFLKGMLKDAVRELNRPDELTGVPEMEEARRLMSGQPPTNPKSSGKPWWKYFWDPVGVSWAPGGALKQLLQNVAKMKSNVFKAFGLGRRAQRLQNMSDTYGVLESTKSFVQQTKGYMDKCKQLRGQMQGIRNQLRNVKSSLEDAYMDAYEATAAVKAAERK